MVEIKQKKDKKNTGISKDKLTILIDKDVKKSFKEYCDEKGLKIGKQVEIFMKEELDRIKKTNNKI